MLCLARTGEHWAALDALGGLATSTVEQNPNLAAAAVGLAAAIAETRQLRPTHDAARRLADAAQRGQELTGIDAWRLTVDTASQSSVETLAAQLT